MPIHTTTPKLTPEQVRILEAMASLDGPIRQEKIPAACGLDRLSVDAAVLVLISYRLIEVDLGAGTLAYRISRAGQAALEDEQKRGSEESDPFEPT